MNPLPPLTDGITFCRPVTTCTAVGLVTSGGAQSVGMSPHPTS